MNATITDTKDFPQVIWANIERDGKTSLEQLELYDYECLEVVEYYSGEGYAVYVDSEGLFPDAKFYVDIHFTREGQDFVPEGINSDNMEIEYEHQPA